MTYPPNEHLPAFPFACQGPTTGPEFYYGLTKREHFAALAMQGLLADPRFRNTGEGVAIERHHLSGLAVGYADALITALNEEPK